MSNALAASSREFSRVWIIAAVVALLSVVGVSIAPIVTFVLMISAFGLPHVIYELRYCDERFSQRASRSLLGLLGLLVALIAGGRIANGLHWMPSSIFVPYELGLGAVLALTAVWHMQKHRWLGAVIGLAFVLGATYRPIETFLVWAWVHNLTPLGFVAEITEGAERRRWLSLLLIPFVLLPLIVATGGVQVLVQLVAAFPELYTRSVFGAGDLPLLSFLPPESYDLNLFSAAVVAQAMHYVAVIVLLPQLLKSKARAAKVETIVRWPDWPVFAAITAVISVIAFALYSVSYSDAKAGYAVAAAIHAWIELPILLLALGQGFSSERK